MCSQKVRSLGISVLMTRPGGVVRGTGVFEYFPCAWLPVDRDLGAPSIWVSRAGGEGWVLERRGGVLCVEGGRLSVCVTDVQPTLLHPGLAAGLLDRGLEARDMALTTTPEVACVPSHEHRRPLNSRSLLRLFLVLKAVGEAVYSGAV